MSSILKALKKAENETDSYKPHTLPPASTTKRGFGKVASIIFILFIVAVVSVVKYSRNSKKVDTDNKNISLSDMKEDAAKQQTITVDKNVIKEEKNDSKLLHQDKIKNSEKADVKKRTVKASVSKPEEKKRDQVYQQQQQNHSEIVHHTETVTKTVLNSKKYEVSGIAFQGENSENVAIVNGKPVVINSDIDGAKIEDIKADKVVFSRDGKRFEVGLGKSGTP